MRQAAVIGVGANDFWTMTPRWLLPLLDAWHEHRQQTLRFDVTVAWLNAAWPRAKRMPSLDKTLAQLGLDIPRRQPRPATAEEEVAAARLWAARVNLRYAQRYGPDRPLPATARLDLGKLKTSGSA